MKINIEETKQLLSSLSTLGNEFGDLMLQQSSSVSEIMNCINIPTLEKLMTDLNSELDKNYKVMVNEIYTIIEFLNNQLNGYAILNEEAKNRIEEIILKINAALSTSVENSNNFDIGSVERASKKTGYSVSN